MNKLLRLQTPGCEELWLDIELPGVSNKYTLAVIYRHPKNNLKIFLDELDEKLQLLNQKGRRGIVLGDFNLDSITNESTTRDYLHKLY